TVQVQDRAHLATLMQNLRENPDVVRLTRV
ncbi:MAG: hypothetical protein GJU73_11775, partial [Ferrovum sp.]|nr:hypothetical protein [Ferrovum sp.]